MLDKNTIRKQMKQKRLALSEETYAYKSLSCFQNIKKVLNQIDYNSIGIYMSINQEMNTEMLLEYLWKTNKDVFIPKCEDDGIMHFYKISSKKDVSKGKFNILEPNTNLMKDQLDVLIIPLTAINSKGYRLGMGGGYYDRFVLNNPCLKIGIGYEFQKEEFLEETHDLKLDYYITDSTITKY